MTDYRHLPWAKSLCVETKMLTIIETFLPTLIFLTVISRLFLIPNSLMIFGREQKQQRRILFFRFSVFFGGGGGVISMT